MSHLQVSASTTPSDGRQYKGIEIKQIVKGLLWSTRDRSDDLHNKYLHLYLRYTLWRPIAEMPVPLSSLSSPSHFL